MSSQELWQWVHYSYGEELGLTSDDDDYVAPLIDDDIMKSKHSDQNLKYIEKSPDRNLLEIIGDVLEVNEVSKHFFCS